MTSHPSARACTIIAIAAGVLLPAVARAQGTSGTPSSSPSSSSATAQGASGNPSDTGAGAARPTVPSTPTTAADFVAQGDRALAAMNAREALEAYEHAIALDSTNYDALCKAARVSVDLGEFERDVSIREGHFATGLRYARRAVDVRPADAEGHFQVARALGRTALSYGGKKRIRYAKEVRAEALLALSYNPNHAGALHVMGVWNAEVMRLSGIERFIAKNLMGGGILGTASWKEAVRYMEDAVAVDPNRITHRLDLGKIYADIGDKAKARDQFQQVISLPAADYNDPHYKQDAEQRLAKL